MHAGVAGKATSLQQRQRSSYLGEGARAGQCGAWDVRSTGRTTSRINPRRELSQQHCYAALRALSG